jgi:hypothetical protein
MPTASYLISDMQVKLGDPSGNIFSTGNLLNWLNEAQRDFCFKVTPLRQIDATIIGTGINTFPIPTGKIIFDGVFTRNRIGMKMKALTFTEYNTQVAACPGAVGIDSDSWTELDQTLYVYPAYGTAAVSTLCPIGENATTTTIRVTSTTHFKAWGRILTSNGEEIEYSSIDSTHFYGCTRGLGGTIAASISKGARITQCDLWMVYRRLPTTMSAMTDTPEIRETYHEGLQLYAMYLAYRQTGEMDKAKTMYTRWEELIKRADYVESREHLDLISLHDTETQGFNHLDGPR